MKISSLFKPLSFLPALALMYMIYSFSSQPADSSTSTSFYVSKKLVQAVDTIAQKGWDDWEIETHAAQINGIVRKGAHITEYFLLAIAVSFPLYVYGVRGILLMLLAGVICVGYACGDEYHQSMVSGRAATARDVLIDSIGIFFGVILTRLIGWSGRMAITGPAYERRQKKQQQELDAREEELRRREEALRREEIRYRRQRYAPRRQRGGYAPYEADERVRTAGTRPETDVRARAAGPGPEADRRERPAGPGPEADVRVRAAGPRPEADARVCTASSRPEADARVRAAASGYAVDDRTRVIGTSHEVDDRTRVYRSEEEQRRMDEAYRAQVYERRRVQSPELAEDSTSDQLSEDLPFSGLFRKK